MTADIATVVPSVANGGITNGGKTYTFHLRHGVMFQPPVSREVTAHRLQVVAGAHAQPKMSPRAPAGYLYDSIVGAKALEAGKATHAAGIKVVNPYTLEIDLTQPNYIFDEVMALPFTAVLAKEWVAKYRARPIARHPLGTRPFMFDHWSNGQEIVLQAQPELLRGGQPLPERDRLRVRRQLHDGAAQAGARPVDVLGGGIPSGEYQRRQPDPTWKKQVRGRRRSAGTTCS